MKADKLATDLLSHTASYLVAQIYARWNDKFASTCLLPPRHMEAAFDNCFKEFCESVQLNDMCVNWRIIQIASSKCYLLESGIYVMLK